MKKEQRTMLQDAITGGVIGAAGGYGLGKIAKNLEKQRILNNANNSELFNNWFYDYVDGMINQTKPLAEYRGLKQGIEKSGKREVLYDRINRQRKEIWLPPEEYATVYSEIWGYIMRTGNKDKIIKRLYGNYAYTVMVVDDEMKHIKFIRKEVIK
ncbi:MAG: hypothetical protein ACI37R_01000 [Candidatus Avigastranaerophilus sp.]